MAITNERWYRYDDLGGYFRLEDGMLVTCPMKSDGSRDDDPFVVDFMMARDEEDVVFRGESMTLFDALSVIETELENCS